MLTECQIWHDYDFPAGIKYRSWAVMDTALIKAYFSIPLTTEERLGKQILLDINVLFMFVLS